MQITSGLLTETKFLNSVALFKLFRLFAFHCKILVAIAAILIYNLRWDCSRSLYFPVGVGVATVHGDGAFPGSEGQSSKTFILKHLYDL